MNISNNTCEETSGCSKIQSAICFHCNHRLCLVHITEHNRIISHINNVSNEIKITFQQIHEESDKRKDIFNNIITSFQQWRTEQIKTIDKIYQNHLQIIESQREILSQEEIKLFKQLDFHVRQPLEYLQKEEVKQELTVNINLINHIQQINKQIREDNKYLKWKLTTTIPPPISPSNPPTIDNNHKIIHAENGRALKRLVQLFANTSSIEQTKKDIFIYIEKLGSQYQLPVVICSYLTAWYKKSKLNEKVYLLNEHITTIQNYLNKSQTDFDVLIGIQTFFHNQEIKEDKSELMTFLLQFFLNHNCIDQNQIFNWYKNDIHGYKGFNLAKQLATPFINSIEINNVKIFIDQIEIKQEPMIMV